ncbi:hypothetical protein ACEWY4_002591 [Coilia grayii]|uniref:Protein phosphatase 1 regulatory subunit 1B n=1 Tax=Coilia grayii TaxID=363190 RepID=A0ABD1KNU4_9TELE
MVPRPCRKAPRRVSFCCMGGRETPLEPPSGAPLWSPPLEPSSGGRGPCVDSVVKAKGKGKCREELALSDRTCGWGRLIRRRRPTPATLFRVADQPSPEDDNSSHQWVVGENGVLKPKRANPNVYQPPSLKAVQQMAEAQMQKLGVYPHMEEESEDYPGQGEEDEETVLTESRDQQEEVGSTDTGSEMSTAKAVTQSGVEEENEEEEEEEEVEKEPKKEEGSRKRE